MTAAEAREWLSSIRFSGFAVIMLGLVVLGVFVLAPTVSTYVEQRQKIAALEDAIQVTEDEIAALKRERDRWRDPAYITTQARERLYYNMPGEVSFLVVNDLEATDLAREPEPISAEVEESRSEWTTHLLSSVIQAGLAQVAVEAPSEPPADEPPADEAPAP
ncbi:FtsB family cell division protein [Microbacterium album]|uniref:Septum formation initiator n=1 Tax=Microbacterium album TaxID=2053191 RepID=A0A917MN13_9MICO|nr:septum formation initiator family protein [Microbacterium album]GGH38320.1 hypothetical protein GCM10010921_08830 [Microbacterium album]